MRGASSTPATHSSTLCAAGCVQPAASAELCASHTSSLGCSISALSTPPDFSRSSISGLACVGGVDVQLCGACVRSGFFGVCSPAGFRFACPFRLAVVVRLGWFGACVRSFSWRVFAVDWLLGFCVGCGLWVVVFLFFLLCSFAGMICYLVVRGVPLCWRPPCGFRFVGVCVCSRPRSCACCPPGPWLGRRVVAGGGVLFAVSSFFRLWLWLGCRSGWF